MYIDLRPIMAEMGAPEVLQAFKQGLRHPACSRAQCLVGMVEANMKLAPFMDYVITAFVARIACESTGVQYTIADRFTVDPELLKDLRKVVKKHLVAPIQN